MKRYISPEHEFEWELSCITSDLHREIAIKALDKAPEYFWVAPASSSGKYHPKSSLGIGGLLRHTKAVFRISEELLSHPLYAPFTEAEKNDIRVAIILHDSCKQGTENTGTHTVEEHPKLVREHCKPYTEGEATKDMVDTWNYICVLIETHMGIWNTDKEGNVILAIPEQAVEKFVHMCDYLASRKIIEVDVQPRKPQQGYKANTAWRDEPAKDAQVEFIKSLYEQCGRKGIKVDPVVISDSAGKRVITKGVASDLITKLKGLLNT